MNVRWLLLLLVLVAPALADSKTPDRVTAEEALTLENLDLRIALLTQQRVQLVDSLKRKYALGDEDEIDRQTLTIRRAPKRGASPPGPKK